tara:strand:- start:1653 stop:1943 length:291 start_codon:yes stop_codon:yes gene_type:complete
MTHQSKQRAITALETAEEQPTSQQIEEAKKLKRHWTRKYPREKLELFSDISGTAVEDLIKEAVDEWIKTHADKYIAKYKAEQIAIHEQTLAELKNS